MKKYIATLLLTFSSVLHAQIFKVEVVDYGGLDSIDAVKNFIDSSVKDFQDDVNEKIPNGSTSRIMKGMGNTSVVSGKGVSSDYSSHMEKYLIGASIGTGLDLDRPTGTESDYSGVGLASAVVVGANLNNMGVNRFAGLDGKKVNAYVHYMQYGRAESLVPFIGMDSEVGVNIKTMGFRMSYDWIGSKEHRHYSWGGVKLHWGYQYNESEFNFEHDLDVTFNVAEEQNIQGQVTGRPKYRVNVVTNSIPLEISSDITFFKILTFFGGAGMDLNYGQAKGHAKSNGDVSPLVCTDSGAACGGGSIIQVQVQASADAQAWVDPVTFRGFLGTQINLPYVQLYGIAEKPIGNEILGLAVGVRFVR